MWPMGKKQSHSFVHVLIKISATKTIYTKSIEERPQHYFMEFVTRFIKISATNQTNPFLFRMEYNIPHHVLFSSSILRKGVTPSLKQNVVLHRRQLICIPVVILTVLDLK